MNVDKHCLFLFLTFLSPMVSAAQHGKETELRSKLNVRVAQYALSANSLADALAKTSRQFELPTGIEWSKDKQTTTGLNHTWRNETLDHILRSILDAYSGYDVEVEHGLVHVFRRDLLADDHNFLNLKLPEFFEAPHEAGGLINQRLRSQVQLTVSSRPSTPGSGEAGSYATGVAENPLTLELRGVTVREALERLTAASEHKIWIITFSEGLTKTPSGFYRTETLWHPRPFPDQDQPMWDFLTWGQYAQFLNQTNSRLRN